MADTRELASQILILEALSRAITKAKGDVRERLQMAMDRGARQPGFVGDAKLGAVTLTDPEASWRVTDRPAFEAWVRANRPDEIVSVESVRTSYESAVLAAGADGGEVPDGVDLVTGASVLQVRPEKDAEAKLTAALAVSGQSVTDLLASFGQASLPSGEAS